MKARTRKKQITRQHAYLAKIYKRVNDFHDYYYIAAVDEPFAEFGTGGWTVMGMLHGQHREDRDRRKKNP